MLCWQIVLQQSFWNRNLHWWEQCMCEFHASSGSFFCLHSSVECPKAIGRLFCDNYFFCVKSPFFSFVQIVSFRSSLFQKWLTLIPTHNIYIYATKFLEQCKPIERYWKYIYSECVIWLELIFRGFWPFDRVFTFNDNPLGSLCAR